MISVFVCNIWSMSSVHLTGWQLLLLNNLHIQMILCNILKNAQHAACAERAAHVFIQQTADPRHSRPSDNHTTAPWRHS